jgi:formate hydrogenlyase transcriptional activator
MIEGKKASIMTDHSKVDTQKDNADDPTYIQTDGSSRSRLLLEINNAVVSNLDLQKLLQVVAECLHGALAQILSAALSLYNTETDQLLVHALALERSGDFLTEGIALPPTGTPGALAFTTQKVVLIEKLTVEEFPSDLVKRAVETGTTSICSVPLTIYERRLGVLSVGSTQEGAFSKDDAELLNEIGKQIAIAVNNALIPFSLRKGALGLERNRLDCKIVENNLTALINIQR